MTTQSLPRVLTFYRSGPMPCPYIPGRIEQQLFTELVGSTAQHDFERLSQGGFRRSHHIVYRPACPGCSACLPVRVGTERFEMTRAWRRVVNLNADLDVQDVGKRVDDEQFALFHRYVTTRHAHGDMARMNRRDYAAMVLSSPVSTHMLEFRDAGGRLRAGCLVDRLSDGYSAVYSFYDPDADRRSLGSLIVLTLIRRAQQRSLPYVYLGFWVADSAKMAYKARFRPLEAFGHDGWQPLRLPVDAARPIAERPGLL